MFSGSTPSLSKNRSRATEKADIYRRNKQIQHLKKLEYCLKHNVIHYCMNVIIVNQKFQPILFTYPFQSLAIVRICFEAEI